jgi:outer membrane protein
MSFRRFVTALCVFAPLVTSVAARADTKFAYVDLQRALQEVDEGRNARTRLKGLQDAKQKELDSEQENFRKQKEMLDKQASAMSEETRMQKQQEMEKRLYELQQKWMKDQQELKTHEQQEVGAIFGKMDPIIAGIAQREGFTMVFDKSNAGLVYAPASLDITNELVRLYNDQYHGGGKASAPTGKSVTSSKTSSDVAKH